MKSGGPPVAMIGIAAAEAAAGIGIAAAEAATGIATATVVVVAVAVAVAVTVTATVMTIGAVAAGGGGPSRACPTSPSDGPSEVLMQVAEGLELSELAEDAHEVMRDILTGMGFGMTAKMSEDDDAVRFDLDSGVYHPALTANNMELLEAVQHLVDKIVNFDAEDRKRIVVDSQGAKAASDQHLGDSARELAEKVMAEGEPIKVGPLDPRSRRIVHVALRDVKGVTTKSEGEGAFRRVCILPAR